MPTQADINLGRKIRQRRMALGITQGQLAEFLGVTFQQVQKYEGGLNRTTAIKLKVISQVLEVPIDYFYEHSKKLQDTEIDQFDALTWRVLRAFPKISSKAVRLRLASLIEKMADEGC